ncbi:N-acetylneuraminate synthase family protein [Neptuniibacter sp. QD48_11]|uniref:N-acetylneuraminate synthase family protein n=1 Tax=unclassified Neptuniibacter TaxID=2630693 RepID=UPI0039F63861
MLNNIEIGSRLIGDGEPCYIIAEIGSNHNHSYDMACDLIKAAADAGADAVKFQTFKAKEHYSKFAPGFSYLDGQDTHELIASLELDRSWQKQLKAYAESCGVDFFSSPCDSEAIAELAELDVPAYKVASFDLTDDRLITEMAAVGKPIILSTGMATWMDIQIAVDAAKTAGNNDIILLQCTSLYPAPDALSNLQAIATLKNTFGLHAGYSDHTEGDHICIAAVALGAKVIEKHFTLDRSLPGPDHAFAIEPKGFSEMVRKIRAVESGMGDGIKAGPREEEMEMAEKGQRSLHARKNIAAGEVITEEMLVTKRPGLGIAPAMRKHVVGRIAKEDIRADQWVTWDKL